MADCEVCGGSGWAPGREMDDACPYCAIGRIVIPYRTRGIPIIFPSMTPEDEAKTLDAIRWLPGIGVITRG